MGDASFGMSTAFNVSSLSDSRSVPSSPSPDISSSSVPFEFPVEFDFPGVLSDAFVPVGLASGVLVDSGVTAGVLVGSTSALGTDVCIGSGAGNSSSGVIMGFTLTAPLVSS